MLQMQASNEQNRVRLQALETQMTAQVAALTAQVAALTEQVAELAARQQ